MQIDQHGALALIDEGTTAEGLLNDYCPGAITRYRRNITALHKTMQEIRKTFPDAQLYVASGTLCLMIGDSHTHDRHAEGQLQLVVDADKRINIDGGDW